MLLAGDLGATKTLLGLFEPRPVRPVPAAVRTFATRDFRDLGDMVAAFLAAEGAPPDRIEAASIGVAGPVGEDRARLTNAGWMVAAADLTRRFGVLDVRLLNDLEATAWGLTALHRFTHAGPCPEVGEAIEAAGRPAAISRAALESGCLECRNALDLFVTIYGAAGGNLGPTAPAAGGGVGG